MRIKTTDAALSRKLCDLTAILQSSPPVAVAFSGGADSTFLLKFAHSALGGQAVAATAVAGNFAEDETAEAISFCAANGISHVLVEMGDAFLESFEDNPKDRCYICKKSILSRFLSHPALKGMALVDGSNADDVFDCRPGEKALLELCVASPLREANLTKQEIRAASREMGLAVWDKPALACLASRVPYGDKLTIGKLKSIYALEKLLRGNGFAQVRVRHHGSVARIEVLPEDRVKFFSVDLMDKVNEAAKGAGFAYAALDLGGYRMGSMNLNASDG